MKNVILKKNPISKLQSFFSSQDKQTFQLNGGITTTVID